MVTVSACCLRIQGLGQGSGENTLLGAVMPGAQRVKEEGWRQGRTGSGPGRVAQLVLEHRPNTPRLHV